MRSGRGGVAAVGGRSRHELVEFLTKVLKVDLAGLSMPMPAKVACHYTCHNRGLHQPPETCTRLLGGLGNVTLMPLEKADQCCGFGGTFAVKYPEISGPLAMDKASCAAKSGADVLLVNDAGCAMNTPAARIGEVRDVFKIAIIDPAARRWRFCRCTGGDGHS